jgi:hypothetical protein
MRRVIKVLAVVLVAQAVVYGVAQAVRLVLKQRSPGNPDPLADEFDIVNVMDGTEFASHAVALRAGSVKNVIGGVMIDLRDAQLSPGGAFLEIQTFMGGTEVMVPRGWRVRVVGDAIAGAHELDATPEDDLEADSPDLTIQARTIMGALDVKAATPRTVTA